MRNTITETTRSRDRKRSQAARAQTLERKAIRQNKYQWKDATR